MNEVLATTFHCKYSVDFGFHLCGPARLGGWESLHKELVLWEALTQVVCVMLQRAQCT